MVAVVEALLYLPPLILEAAIDPQMRAKAVDLWNTLPPLLEPKERIDGTVRMSDTGKCRRELWADIHGKLDLPPDPLTAITRFDLGTLYGAWLACLEVAAIHKHAPHLTTMLEPEVAYRGVSGHIDVLCFEATLAGDLPCWVIENKSTYWSGVLEPPHEAHPYQVQQAGGYGLATAAPIASIVTIGPAARGMKLQQFDYLTADLIANVDAELARLSAATADIPPEGDAVEPWRCKSCRFSDCARNANRARLAS